MEKLPHTFAPGRMCCIIFRSAGCASLQAYFFYFHGAAVGHKADALKKDDRVCFTVYGNEMVKEEPWTPFLQSVVVFGRCRILEDRNRTIDLVRQIAKKYYPDDALIEGEIAQSGRV